MRSRRPGQDLVRVGLMADVPDRPVARGGRTRSARLLVNSHAEARAEMPARDRNRIGWFPDAAIGDLADLFHLEPAQIVGVRMVSEAVFC